MARTYGISGLDYAYTRSKDPPKTKVPGQKEVVWIEEKLDRSGGYCHGSSGHGERCQLHV
jgi:hypothetical protein